jgi:hypothetical protein
MRERILTRQSRGPLTPFGHAIEFGPQRDIWFHADCLKTFMWPDPTDRLLKTLSKLRACIAVV